MSKLELPRSAIHRLSAQAVERAMPARADGSVGYVRLCDGGGLYLVVTPGAPFGKKRRPPGKAWLFRYKRGGKWTDLGLGPLRDVNLKTARDEAAKLRLKLRLMRDDPAASDPLAERRALAAQRKVDTAKAVTFREAAKAYIKLHEKTWRNDKHAAQWSSTLETYAFPTIGSLPVSSVDTPHLVKVLQTIWLEKSETANRVRQRIEMILNAATVRGLRSGPNPARWKGHLQNLLPHKTKVKRVKHHAALPYTEVGAFMVTLREQPGVAARLLEFTILTACRTGETMGACWSEIDLDQKVWTIPAERMKGGRQHAVPLSPRALAILAEMRELRHQEGDFVFVGQQLGRPLSNMAMLTLLRRMKRDDITVHGFRSSFSDWSAEQTNFQREVREMALAHAISAEAEAAYRRGDLFEKRKRLMSAWADYCAAPPARGAKVVAMRGRRA
ncbi:MAG: tyrosine-type recombinase/integrase [Alphaproteobacteria bacterium]|nr:tyrosine-type recombinase/integrase [Alphaproteobacteria bacterium]